MKKVIIVDDSNMILKVLKSDLESEYEVISATDGMMALEKVNAYLNSDVVCMLLDLNMPNYDGFMVLNYFKENDLFKKIPVCIISGDDTKDTINRVFNYDTFDMINKPFTKESVLDKVKKAEVLFNK